MPKRIVAHQTAQPVVVARPVSMQPNYVPIRKSLTKKQAKQGPIAWLDRDALQVHYYRSIYISLLTTKQGMLLLEHVGHQQDLARHAQDYTPLGGNLFYKFPFTCLKQVKPLVATSARDTMVARRVPSTCGRRTAPPRRSSCAGAAMWSGNRLGTHDWMDKNPFYFFFVGPVT